MAAIERELRAFRRRRRQVAVEAALCLGVGAALVLLAPAVEAGPVEARVIFFALCAFFGAQTAGTVARLVPVLLFRCPRCRERFHGGDEPRRGMTWRACAHCGLAQGAPPRPRRERG